MIKICSAKDQSFQIKHEKHTSSSTILSCGVYQDQKCKWEEFENLPTEKSLGDTRKTNGTKMKRDGDSLKIYHVLVENTVSFKERRSRI